MPTKYLIIKRPRDPWVGHPTSFVVTRPDSTDATTHLPCRKSRKVFTLHASTKHVSIAIHQSEDKEKHMRPNNTPGLTAELTKRVGAEAVPSGIRRRASANVTHQTEPVVPTWTAPAKNTRRVPTIVLFLTGALLALILIFVGIQVKNWITEVNAHWHGGDYYVTAIDADFGHGGTSHLLAFYTNGTVVVVELSSDYSTTHSYTVPVHPKGSDHHAVTLALQIEDGRRDLLITLDDGTGSTLYNTGSGFSLIQP